MLKTILCSALALLAAYIIKIVRYKRLYQYAHFPQMPPSPIFGHLQIIDQYMRLAAPNAHPGIAFTAMYEALGRPPAMFLDLRPAAPPMLLVGTYEVAEQAVKASSCFPQSPPKDQGIFDHMVHICGPTSILSTSGEKWKVLRKRFNPGFSTQHLMTLLPSIVDKTKIFVTRLESLVQSQQTFSLQDLAIDFTFDVMGTLILDVDMKAQSELPADFIVLFQELMETYSSEQIDLPWWFTPRIEWKRKRLATQIRKILQDVVREKFASNKQQATTRGRSILSMSLQHFNSLSQEDVDVTCDQMSSFIFAGHDTTGTTIAWAVYELSRSRSALRAVRAELDKLFGPDRSPAAIATCLLAEGADGLVHQMPYTTAVLKETLRLWPPAATARMSQPGDGLHLMMESEGRNKRLNVDGIMLHPLQYAIHRDPDVFGETAHSFVPERWLGSSAEKLPAGAWRPFERGPRNCIGQELAMIEARIVIAFIARLFNFTKIGIGASYIDNKCGAPVVGDHGQSRTTEDMYQTRQVTAKPIDGMMMQVKYAGVF